MVSGLKKAMAKGRSNSSSSTSSAARRHRDGSGGFGGSIGDLDDSRHRPSLRRQQEHDGLEDDEDFKPSFKPGII